MRAAFRTVRAWRPFALDAIAIMPDHVHTLWTLPADDTDFSIRWSRIKGCFTRAFLAAGGDEADRGASRCRRGERGVWQRRFWDHVIRDDADLSRHFEYILYNPVRHGLVDCPHAWPHSSFGAHVRAGVYDADWMCICRGRTRREPDFRALREGTGE